MFSFRPMRVCLASVLFLALFIAGCSESPLTDELEAEGALNADSYETAQSEEGLGTPFFSSVIKGAPEKNLETTVLSSYGPRAAVIGYCTDIGGSVGIRNTAIMLAGDGRFSSVTAIDGDAVLPSAEYLLDNYDVIIAMTDNRCGIPMPQYISDSAADALSLFAQKGGGVVVATFGFSHRPSGGLGFGASIFNHRWSPLSQATPYANAPAGSVNVGAASSSDRCDGLFDGVYGGMFSSYANYVAPAHRSTVCAKYYNGRDFIAVNATGHVIGLNTFPAAASNTAQYSYRKLVSNAVYKAYESTQAKRR